MRYRKNAIVLCALVVLATTSCRTGTKPRPVASTFRAHVTCYDGNSFAPGETDQESRDRMNKGLPSLTATGIYEPGVSAAIDPSYFGTYKDFLKRAEQGRSFILILKYKGVTYVRRATDTGTAIKHNDIDISPPLGKDLSWCNNYWGVKNITVTVINPDDLGNITEHFAKKHT